MSPVSAVHAGTVEATGARLSAERRRLWDAPTADGGEPGPCGWLKDEPLASAGNAERC